MYFNIESFDNVVTGSSEIVDYDSCIEKPGPSFLVICNGVTRNYLETINGF